MTKISLLLENLKIKNRIKNCYYTIYIMVHGKITKILHCSEILIHFSMQIKLMVECLPSAARRRMK